LVIVTHYGLEDLADTISYVAFFGIAVIGEGASLGFKDALASCLIAVIVRALVAIIACNWLRNAVTRYANLRRTLVGLIAGLQLVSALSSSAAINSA